MMTGEPSRLGIPLIDEGIRDCLEKKLSFEGKIGLLASVRT